MKPKEEKAARLFLLHHDFVKDRVLRFAPLPDLVDDICQQVFLEFVSRADKWTYDEDIRPLLGALAKNFSLRAVQEQKKHQPGSLSKLVGMILQRSESLAEKQNEWESSYEYEKGALKHCIEHLPIRYREIIRMHYYEERPLREIGDLMLLSANAVGHALCRIRERLRKCIRQTLLERESGS